MKIEIWSDVMCPFCWLGKRKFESALAQFAESRHVQVEWKSFQLNPSLRTDTTVSIYDYLSRQKGISVEQAKSMNARVSGMGEQVGVEFNFDTLVVANSFDAHRLLHFAKEHGRQNEAEERLFRACFTEGKNVDDRAILIELGTEIGLDPGLLSAALEDGSFAQDVRADIDEAQQLGIHSVPFFVFDRKYAVSGAQESDAFLSVLEKSFAEWREQHPAPAFEVTSGPSCDADGVCE